jgi:hypothetical protein
MNITRKALEFERWFNSSEFPKNLEKADVEECVLAWADVTETDLGDNLNEICERIVELGIC